MIGYLSGDAITNGINNSGCGAGALGNLTTGDYNSALGYYAGINATDANRNVYVGQESGTSHTTGLGGVYIGMFSAASAGNNNYEIVIGYSTTGKGTQTGFINPVGGGVYQGNNSSSWSTTSDRRIKKNIEDNTTGLDAIKQIRVRNFEYKTEDEITDFENPKAAVVEKEGKQLGVIAQEIQDILPDMVKTESTGVMTVDPDNLTWYLVNAVKELSAKVEELESKLNGE